MPLSALYKTPIDYVLDLRTDGGNAATRLVESVRAQFMPMVDGFETGRKMWDEKHLADVAKYDFEKKYLNAKGWTQEAEDDGVNLYTRIATYLAKYDKSSPEVQQTPRVVSDQFKNSRGVTSSYPGQGGATPYYKRPSGPSRSGFPLVAVGLTIAVLFFLHSRKGK